MISSIGVLELNSIAKGVEAADFMVKAADVNLIFAKSVCPGKYIILIAGEISAVKSSLEIGKEIGLQNVVDDLLIPNVHKQLIPAINASSDIEKVNAIGIMEFFSISSSIEAADIAAKTADVQLIEVRLGIGIGGKSFVTLSGDVSAVNESVKAGIASAKEKGYLIAYAVIPNPSAELFNQLL